MGEWQTVERTTRTRVFIPSEVRLYDAAGVDITDQYEVRVLEGGRVLVPGGYGAPIAAFSVDDEFGHDRKRTFSSSMGPPNGEDLMFGPIGYRETP